MKMTTGKHKGQEIDSLPTEYLTYLRRRKARPLDPESAAEVSRVWAERTSERLQEATAPVRKALEGLKAILESGGTNTLMAAAQIQDEEDARRAAVPSTKKRAGRKQIAWPPSVFRFDE